MEENTRVGQSRPSFHDRVPYLGRLEDKDRDALLGLGRVVRYPARHHVISEYEPSTHVLLIRRGRMKVTTSAANGYVVLLALRRPGDIVGESAALSGLCRSATVTTLEEAECVAVGRESFLSFLDTHPAAHTRLSGLLAERVRAGDQRALESAALSVRERLAVLLLELARRHSRPTDDGVMLTVPLSKQELAGSVGASREAISRLLAELRDRGVVRTGRRSLEVLREDVLRQLSSGGATRS
ncbi:Crp/Fnr family transcriptional regulator [Streptomyces sodiiphilus]